MEDQRRLMRRQVLQRLAVGALAAVPLWVHGRGGGTVIKVGVGLAKPPYVIETPPSGLEYEIVAAALAAAGLGIDPFFAPQGRLLLMMQNGGLDAMITARETLPLPGMFFSASHIVYHNAAFSLKSRRVVVERIEDLARYSVVAFQNARFLLGDDFRAAVDRSPDYREFPNQGWQNKMLFAGRVDVSIGDRRIFRYFMRALPPGMEADQPVTLHEIFTPTEYKVVFRDSGLRDRFDQGLRLLRASGGYAAIVDRYP